MKKVAITTESTADLSPELIKQYNIHVVPFGVLLGEEMLYDGNFSTTEIFDFVDKTKILPKTCAVNEFQFEEFFKNLLKEYDEIIHISMSLRFSSAVKNARNVAERLGKEKIHVIDSKSLSTGVGLQVIYAAELLAEGKEVDEIVRLVESRKMKAQASFVVNTLDYLYMGGRCSGLSRTLGTILRLKPQILVQDGSMSPGKKYIGKQSACVYNYCVDIIKQFPNICKKHVFITHSHATVEMIEEAKRALREYGVTEVHETIAGATITSHCGPKCLGILYYNDGDIDVVENKVVQKKADKQAKKIEKKKQRKENKNLRAEKKKSKK